MERTNAVAMNGNLQRDGSQQRTFSFSGAESAERGVPKTVVIREIAAHNRGICSWGTPSSLALNNKNISDEFAKANIPATKI